LVFCFHGEYLEKYNKKTPKRVKARKRIRIHKTGEAQEEDALHAEDFSGLV
jgi:hypothetical protein